MCPPGERCFCCCSPPQRRLRDAESMMVELRRLKCEIGAFQLRVMVLYSRHLWYTRSAHPRELGAWDVDWCPCEIRVRMEEDHRSLKAETGFLFQLDATFSIITVIVAVSLSIWTTIELYRVFRWEIPADLYRQSRNNLDTKRSW